MRAPQKACFIPIRMSHYWALYLFWLGFYFSHTTNLYGFFINLQKFKFRELPITFEIKQLHSGATLRRSSCKWAGTFEGVSGIFMLIGEVPQLHITHILGSSGSYSTKQLEIFEFLAIFVNHFNNQRMFGLQQTNRHCQRLVVTAQVLTFISCNTCKSLSLIGEY